MVNRAVDLADKFTLFAEHFSPKVIARLNDYEIKLVRIKGEFVWHTHPDTDELFLVIDGSLTILLRDGNVVLRPGQLFVVPRSLVSRVITIWGLARAPSTRRGPRPVILSGSGRPADSQAAADTYRLNPATTGRWSLPVAASTWSDTTVRPRLST